MAGEDKFLVRETYPVELAKSSYDSLDQDRLKQVLDSAKEKDTLKKGENKIVAKVAVSG